MAQPLANVIYPGYHLSGQQSQNHESVMLAQLRVQIEFYFSPHNLVNDQYLMSLLQSTEHIGAVPLDVIANFPKVRELHAQAFIGQNIPLSLAPPANLQLLRMALQGSPIVTVSSDGRWISPKSVPVPAPTSTPTQSEAQFDNEISKKDTEASATVATTSTMSTPSSPSSQTTSTSSLGVPTFPLPLKERNTVIVRDVPDDATEAQVTEVFSSDMVVPKSVKPDIGNTWYVTFDSEALAVAALSASRDKTIAGAPIRGRLKSELSHPNSASGTPGASAARPVRAMAPQGLQMPMPHDSKLGLPSLQQQQTHPHYLSQLRPQPFHHHHGVPIHHPNHASFTYLPYSPYGMDPMSSYHHLHHHQMAMGLHHHAQQHLYGAPRTMANSQHKQQRHTSQEDPSQPRREAMTSPPPHVYVRPQQQQKAQRKVKKHQKNKIKANDEEQEKSGKKTFEMDSNLSRNTKRLAPNRESAESDRLRKDSNIDNKNINKNGKTHNLPKVENNSNSGSNKKNTNKAGKNKKNKRAMEKAREMLSEENFPALGGEKKSSSSSQQQATLNDKPRVAYAEALLKQPKPPTTAQPQNAKTAELEAAMEKMAFTSTEPATCESYDEW